MQSFYNIENSYNFTTLPHVPAFMLPYTWGYVNYNVQPNPAYPPAPAAATQTVVQIQNVTQNNNAHANFFHWSSNEPATPETLETAFKVGNWVKMNKPCEFCEDIYTPQPRNGPNGPKTLCNACGIKYAKQLKAEQKVKAQMAISTILNPEDLQL
jgi:hypothetical protein